MNMYLISISGATIRNLNTTLLHDLNFDIKKGEHWAITGESGSGKTVLLQTIAGKFNLTGGNTRNYFLEDFLQENPTDDAHLTFHKLISLVESKHHFRNLSNTGDFYYQQRYNSSDSEDALTVDEYLGSIQTTTNRTVYWTMGKTIERLNLVALRDKQLIKLSNGETKRLRIAAALLKNPVILLLDSPLTGLDVQTRKEFNLIIEEIIASGITVIIATSPYEIPDGITHVAVLKEGTIQKVITRDKFDPAPVIINAQKAIDKTELKELLNTKADAPAYTWIVKMDDVNISYSDKAILKHVNWQVKPGDKWALLGPNGAGKSTLLSLINGDNPQAYANHILLFDRKRGSGESIWDIKSKIGFVSPELYQYFPTDNSCLQVIESGFYDTLGLFRPSDPKKAALALRWMKALEIDRYAHLLLKNIPASAQRLCLLARALIKNPPLLIFDEPCQGMDEHQQQHFKMVVDTICGLSPVTLIYVTHYQHEIPESVDKVLRLDKGVVV